MLPAFPPGLVATLATVDADGPAAIPVSALHRTADDRVLLALAPHRASLARLRTDPRVALLMVAEGFAVSARGTARVVADPLPGATFVVGVSVGVTEVRDALGERTLVHAGIAWGWRDDGSAARHEAVLRALRGLPADA